MWDCKIKLSFNIRFLMRKELKKAWTNRPIANPFCKNICYNFAKI